MSHMLRIEEPKDEAGQGRGRVFAGFPAAGCSPPLWLPRHLCHRLHWRLPCQPHPHLHPHTTHIDFPFETYVNS